MKRISVLIMPTFLLVPFLVEFQRRVGRHVLDAGGHVISDAGSLPRSAAGAKRPLNEDLFEVTSAVQDRHDADSLASNPEEHAVG